LGSSQRVCAYLGHLYGAHQTNQRTRRYFQLDWADRLVPFSSYSILATRLCLSCTFARIATRLPIEFINVATRSFAHGSLTSFGRSCFSIALPQIICRRHGCRTSPAPMTQLTASNARRTSFMAQQTTFRQRQFISLMYPAQHVECSNFGASGKFAHYATHRATRIAVIVVSYAVEQSQML
jgi:hypothetical protein